MSRTVRFLALAGAIVTLGCAGGTETGNPSIEAQLGYQAHSSDPAVASIRQALGGVVVESAWLVLGDVGFATGTECAATSAGGQVAPGLGVGDHAAGAKTATQFALESGAYCAVTLPFVRAEGSSLPAEAPPELAGNSVLIQGTLADGTPFSIATPAEPTVRLVANGDGFDMTEEADAALLAFDVAAWLAPVDLDAATRDGGRIVVSPSENAALFAAFEASLGDGIALYRDADRDAVLDADPVRIAQVR